LAVAQVAALTPLGDEIDPIRSRPGHFEDHWAFLNADLRRGCHGSRHDEQAGVSCL
jgi:hypothetical protein